MAKLLNKILNLVLTSTPISTLSLADDLLARLTNGTLSDTSIGVKKLTNDEAKQVVGGYKAYFVELRNTSLGMLP
ncbi:hypothetical protein [Campylobacter troglodytis]|uniref:hypothetical protein n=1 Tax=Campylobacter troglodytis TaxID=654363 RepID=UPI00115800C1|nr:hypothetical protein [Campylobacter troglodytis]TQR61631.1 hypothetical protein DMC01_00235 [Campylobacter troglodytis]